LAGRNYLIVKRKLVLPMWGAVFWADSRITSSTPDGEWNPDFPFGTGVAHRGRFLGTSYWVPTT